MIQLMANGQAWIPNTEYWILGILRVLAALNNGCRTRPTDECSSININMNVFNYYAMWLLWLSCVFNYLTIMCADLFMPVCVCVWVRQCVCVFLWKMFWDIGSSIFLRGLDALIYWYVRSIKRKLKLPIYTFIYCPVWKDTYTICMRLFWNPIFTTFIHVCKYRNCFFGLSPFLLENIVLHRKLLSTFRMKSGNWEGTLKL